jgi:hypothetical protein
VLKKIVPFALAICVATPALAKTHKFNYPQPCSVLWPAVKDTLRNSGKYGIIGISNEELTASYNIGGFLTGKRINSLVLNTIPTGCELQVQTSYSGFVNDDVDALKKRVDESLTKLGSAAPPSAPPAKPVESPQP